MIQHLILLFLMLMLDSFGVIVSVNMFGCLVNKLSISFGVGGADGKSNGLFVVAFSLFISFDNFWFGLPGSCSTFSLITSKGWGDLKALGSVG